MLSANGFGQDRAVSTAIGGPLAGSPIVDAPFSADAVTTLRLTLGDGSRLEQITTARYFRDGEGRVRIELEIPGPQSRSTTTERHIRTIVDERPGDGVVNTLDPITRTARFEPRDLFGLGAGGNGRWFTVPIGGVRFLVISRLPELLNHADSYGTGEGFRDEPLGSQQISGLEVVGRQLSIEMSSLTVGNKSVTKIVDEQWESPALGIVLKARHFDSRFGTIEYRVINVRRAEPASDLFIVPSDYMIDATMTTSEPWLSFTPWERYYANQASESYRRR
jgi:hypothetical protein